MRLLKKSILLPSVLFLWFTTASLLHADNNGWYPSDKTRPFSGNLGIKYQMRHFSEAPETDHLLFQTLNFEARPESIEPVRFIFSGDLFENIGSTNDSRPVSFRETGGDVNGYIYESYCDINRAIPYTDIRAGRQYMSHQFNVHLDGASTEINFLENHGLVFLYGGYEVDLYESSVPDDAKLAGAGCEYFFNERTKIGLEYLLTRESDINEDFHQSSLLLNHYFDSGKTLISLTSFNDDIDSVHILASLNTNDSMISFSYFCQFVEIRQRPSSQSPFINLTGTITPYQQFNFNISHGFSDNRMSVSAGFDWRGLLPGETESEFNHSFGHTFISMEKKRIFDKDIRLTVHVDTWHILDTHFEDKSIITGGGEIDYRLSKKTSMETGSYYSLYTYDYYTDTNEKTDVYSVFLTLKQNLTETIWLKGNYQLDIYDIYEHRLTITTDWQF